MPLPRQMQAFAMAAGPLSIAAASQPPAVDPVSVALFSDPNCTELPQWSVWREEMMDAGQAAAVNTATRALAELVNGKSGRLSALLDPAQPCMLGAAALLFLQTLAEWQHGRFVAALANFAVLHDQLLTNIHPHFYDQSAWPLRDVEVRAMKDMLLYNTRKFRSLAADLLAGQDGSPGKPIPTDPGERENLEGFAAHLSNQREQRGARHATGVEEELVPAWELLPEDALARMPAFPNSSDSAPEAAVPRFFVYDESVAELGILTQGPAYCHNRQWGMDVGFHDFFRVSPLRTFDPEEADFFFVPSYAICLQVAGILDLEALNATFESFVKNLPYFSRTRGRDHIFSLHYVDLFGGWREHAPLSIFLTPETEVGWERSRGQFHVDQGLHPPFDSYKDVSVPPFMRLSHVLKLHHEARPVAARSVLAAFAGKLWADVDEALKVRSQVRDRLGSKEGVVVVVGDSMSDLLSPDAMARLMGDARFCLVPRGRAAWSVRFFETLWAGCVPVLLSDHYEIPFEALFDVSQFVVKWPVARIDDSLYEYLAGLPLAVVEEYTRAARQVRCWFLYPPPEVSWLGESSARQEVEVVERELCPSLSSSRNAFQATAELLGRRKRASKSAMGTTFYWADPSVQPENSGIPVRPVVIDSGLSPILPD